METATIIGVGAIVVAIGAFVAIRIKNSSSMPPIDTEIVDKEVLFSDIVEWFRSQNIQKEKHTPFIAKDTAQILNKFTSLSSVPIDYQSIFIGVYDQKDDKIVTIKRIAAKSFDHQTMETFGDEDFVVLS